MQAGSSSEGQAPEKALSRKTHPVATAVLTALPTGLLALVGSAAGVVGGLAQTEREADLSLRDLRMETYASAVQNLYVYMGILDDYANAAVTQGLEDDTEASERLSDHRPVYLSEWSKAQLLADTELRQRLNKVSTEIDTMLEKIVGVSSGQFGGDTLDDYWGRPNPLSLAVLAFQKQAVSDVRASD